MNCFSLVFEKNEADIKNMFRRDLISRAHYSQKIRSNEDTSSNFFDDSDDNNTKKVIAATNSPLPKPGRSWWQKFFGSE